MHLQLSLRRAQVQMRLNARQYFPYLKWLDDIVHAPRGKSLSLIFEIRERADEQYRNVARVYVGF